MAAFSMHSLIGRLLDFKAGVRRAFAMPPDRPLSADDVALLERVADTVVRRGMAAPAVVFLESMAPMNFLGSQAVHFFAPLVDVVFPQREVERVGLLLERRETLVRLAALIESRHHLARPPRAVFSSAPPESAKADSLSGDAHFPGADTQRVHKAGDR
jgi:hypothetical protein